MIALHQVKVNNVERRKSFVFVAHYIEPWNWLLNFFPFLHRQPRWRFLFLPLYPLFFLISLFYLGCKKPYNVVDYYTVNRQLEGWTILIRNFAWQFAVKRWREKIKQRILAAALHAQDELEADVVGLGALTKAEWLTQGGQWLAERSEITVPIVHGDTATAWFMAKQVEECYRRFDLKTPIMVLGATSKIGRAIVLHLIQLGYRFHLYSKSRERMETLLAEIPPARKGRAMWVRTLAEGEDCLLWVTGKAKPSGRVLSRYIPKGAVVINFSVPDPFTIFRLKRRKDLRHFDGGLVELPENCNMHFMMRLRPGTTYACAAGVMAHAAKGWFHDETGPINMNKFNQIGVVLEQLGFKAPPPTSQLREVNY